MLILNKGALNENHNDNSKLIFFSIFVGGKIKCNHRKIK